MKKRIDPIAKTFALYSNKTETDYFVSIGGRRVPTAMTIIAPDEEGVHVFENGIHSHEFVEMLSPDNIDSQRFWKTATDLFPLFSISGGIQQITTTLEANANGLCMANTHGVLVPVRDILAKNESPKVLEIGPGYGYFKDFMKAHKNHKNYWAIDVNPLFKHPRLFKCDGKNIPDTIPPEMDLVYSMNVFQHLSKKQRTSYYRQIYEVLKDGGVFVFGMFVVTDLNKDWNVWQTKDVDGNLYCNFFRQLTEIDSLIDLGMELIELGFDVERISPIEAQSHYLTFKCTKNG